MLRSDGKAGGHGAGSGEASIRGCKACKGTEQIIVDYRQGHVLEVCKCKKENTK